MKIDKAPSPFGFAFLELNKDDGTAIDDLKYDLPCFKPMKTGSKDEGIMIYLLSDPGYYLLLFF